MAQTIDIDTKISEFINSDHTLRNIKHTEKYSYQTIEDLRHNINSLFLACLIDKVSSVAHFTIRKFSLDGRLRFIVTENNHEPSKEINQHSVTYAYLISDYLNKYLNNQIPLDPEQVSCSYDQLANTWTLTTDIPAL